MISSNIFLTFFVFGISLCDSYRILAIFPFKGRSHNNVNQPIAMALANKGHQVDVISHFPLKEPIPNYTDIIKLQSNDYPQIDYVHASTVNNERKWFNMQKNSVCNFLGHPKIVNLIKNPPTNPPYDLLLVHFLVGYQCFSAIGYYWDIPVVGIVGTTPYPQFKPFIGEPQNLAIFPSTLRYYIENMNFWERLYNVISNHYSLFIYHKNANIQDYYIKKYISADMPSYSALETKVSILLSNSHYSFYGIKPTVPALIEVGGINIRNDNSTTLSPNLKKYLDESKHGFIYFSFGSLFATETLPIEVLQRFYNVLRKISPMRVLMRVQRPDAMPKNLPNNVLMNTWLPQQQILQHPNIKAFVSHGGGLGTQEAIYNEVPMICVPLFDEHYADCDILSLKNCSKTIDVKTAQQKDYDNAFQEILNNPLYKESMRKLSILYRDRPQSPKDTAIYWIEYVIHHGKNVLRSSTIGLKWWQSKLLDVYAFILTCSIIILFITIFIIKLMCKLFIRKLCFGIIKISKKLN